MIPAARPYFADLDKTVLPDIAATLRSGRLILGPQTSAFEREFADYIGTTYAVAVGSGSAALEIVFRYLAAREWPQRSIRKVPMSTNTFVASYRAAVAAGFEVPLLGMDPQTLNASIVELQPWFFSPQTIAILLVHIAGIITPHIHEIASAGRLARFPVIEDCAHAHGSTIDGKKAGSLGFAGCFSFYATKVMTTGTGGMITTNNDALAQYARQARHHGGGGDLTKITVPGSDWLMTEIEAILGRSQLRALPMMLERRRLVAMYYREMLKEEDRVELLTIPPSVEPAWYKYPLYLTEGINREKVREYLGNCGIEVGTLYDPPVHTMLGIDAKSERQADAQTLLKRQLCLPVHGLMTVDDAGMVVRSFKRALDLAI
jgi:perosamine synthetase